MIPPEGQRIIELEAQGKHSEALGVSRNATSDDILTAHLRSRYRFDEYPEVKSALDEAKAALLEQPKAALLEQPKAALHTELKAQSPFRIRITLYWTKFISLVAGIIIIWPFRIVAMAGTALVIWHNIHNIVIMIIIVVAVFLPFMVGLLKKRYQSLYFKLSAAVLFYSGFTYSMRIVLYRFTPLLNWACIVLALILGFMLGRYIGDFLLGAIINKLQRPDFWECVGVFCVLFMVTFGLVDLFLSEVPVTEITYSALSDIQNNKWLFIIVGIVFIYILGTVFARFYSGAIFRKSNWIWEWNNASEYRFCFGFIATILTTRTVLELILYVPFIKEYIGGVRDIIIVVPEPLSKHIREFFFYYGFSSILAINLYFFFVGIVKHITKKNNLPVVARFLVGGYLFWGSVYLINWAFLILRP